MNPNFHQDIQNILNQNISNKNQYIPNQDIQNITILKTEEQKQINDINSNLISNNLEKNPQIFEETKIITQTYNNSINPQRFTFSDISNLYLPFLDNKNKDYIKLIKKIANQLKRKVRPPTQGFFHFALQKGDYSLIIIKKLSSQMRNHKIEFSNEIFRIYTQKLIKYRELIKRIAHLLKITMKNKKYFENLNNKLNNSVQTIEKKTIVQTNVNTNNNLNRTNNIKKNNEIKKVSVKTEQMKIVGNNKIFDNPKKTKTQTINQTNLNKSNINKSHKNQNRYNTNINNNKINPINPFFASKDKLSFNANNNNIMKNNLQNQNQYFLNNKEKTSIPNNSKSPISQSLNINKNKNMIDVNLNKQQNNINNNKNKVKIVKNNNNNNQNQVKIVKSETEITTNNITTTNNINKMDIVQEKIKPNLDIEVNKREKIIIPHLEEKNDITTYNHQETHNIINSISNYDKETNTINNYNISENRIFSNTPINSAFTEIQNDIEMKNNVNNLNILSEKNKAANMINSSLVNTGNFQQIPKNNIETNTINFERKSISVNLVNNNSKDKNKINKNESNTNNMSNISMNNNFNSESNNNITISSLNKEEDKNYNASIESNKSKGKQIKIKLSPFKKDINRYSIEEEKTINSNMGSQTININNIQKLNCNTFTENDINNDIKSNDSIIYQKEISTYPDEASFLKKFDSFLIKNNISIQSFIPMAINNNGQQYLKQNAFWEKYINYIFINYSVNNKKISLFSFAHLIEQYFLWCENLSSDIVEGFKKLIIEIISKIYNNEEINQFCTMNKINNIGDLFEKYKILIKNKNDGFKYDKEIEIKIKNKDQNECNCELCKNEISCMKKLIELNKNKIIGVNIESIFYNGKINKPKNKSKEEVEDEEEDIYIKKSKKTYPPTKSRNSSGKKKSYPKFSASKIKESSVENVEFIGKERSKSKKRASSSKQKRQSSIRKSSSSSKKKRRTSSKKEKKDEDIKIDTYFIKETYVEEEKEKEEIDLDKADKDNKKKDKNKKKEKSKSRSKREEKKYESGNESEEKETKNKKNKKKQKSKNKKKEKKYSDSESEEEKLKVKEKKKKKQQYPKE